MMVEDTDLDALKLTTHVGEDGVLSAAVTN
jgi:hypothetical protein